MDKPNPYPVASQTSSAAIDTTQHPTGQNAAEKYGNVRKR